jgi:hypothetical protein
MIPQGPTQAPPEQSLPVEAAAVDGKEGIKEAKTGDDLNQGAESIVQKFLAGALKQIDGLTTKSNSAKTVAAGLSEQAKIDSAATADAKAANATADTAAEVTEDLTFAGMMPDAPKTETVPRMKQEEQVVSANVSATAKVESKGESPKKEDPTKLRKEDKPQNAKG